MIKENNAHHVIIMTILIPILFFCYTAEAAFSADAKLTISVCEASTITKDVANKTKASASASTSCQFSGNNYASFGKMHYDLSKGSFSVTGENSVPLAFASYGVNVNIQDVVHITIPGASPNQPTVIPIEGCYIYSFGSVALGSYEFSGIAFARGTGSDFAFIGINAPPFAATVGKIPINASFTVYGPQADVGLEIFFNQWPQAGVSPTNGPDHVSVEGVSLVLPAGASFTSDSGAFLNHVKPYPMTKCH